MTCAEYKKRMIVTGIVVTFFIAGCGGGLGNRGKVVAQPLGGKKETIEKLIDLLLRGIRNNESEEDLLKEFKREHLFKD